MNTSGTLLTLIRHGQSLWNAEGRAQGHADVVLSPIGEKQAALVAECLVTDGSITALYSSDSMRCRQTASPIAAALGMPATFDQRLREVDVGIWQGMKFSDIREQYAHEFAAYMADPFHVAIPGGENRMMMRRRVMDGITEILQRHSGQHIVVVLHGGPIEEILRVYGLMSLAPDDDDNPVLRNTSRTVLRVTAGGKIAEPVMIADVTHLPADLQT